MTHLCYLASKPIVKLETRKQSFLLRHWMIGQACPRTLRTRLRNQGTRELSLFCGSDGVLAFQTDTTRVCTLKLNNDHGYLQFPHLGVERGHHDISHDNNAQWLKVNQFFLEQFAYIARKLDAIQEGERTALDNSMLRYCSSMITGTHDATQLPVVLLGGAGAPLQGGRVLDYLGQPNCKMCILYLSMLDKHGIHLERFGDSTERLAEV